MKNLAFDLEVGKAVVGEIEISSTTGFRDLLARLPEPGRAHDGLAFSARSPLTLGEDVSLDDCLFKADAYFNAQEKIKSLSFLLLNGRSNADQSFDYELVVLDKKKVSKIVFREVTSAKDLATSERDACSFKWGRVVVEANPLSMCCHINVLYRE